MDKNRRFNVGDKFVELNAPEWGIGTVTEVFSYDFEEDDDRMWFKCVWEGMKFSGSRYDKDKSIVELEIYNSSLYQLMKEEEK